jgi:DNA primase
VFDTPERRAQLEAKLRDLTGRIRDESVRRHYSQDMRERVYAFFGRDRGGRDRYSQQGGGGYGGGRGRTGQAPGRFAVTESLARSALFKGDNGPLPTRETVMLVAMVNHPTLLDEHFDAFEQMDLPHPDLKRLHGAVLDAMAHGVAHERGPLLEAIERSGAMPLWEKAVALVRKAREWTALETAALDDVREAFGQATALYSRVRELRRQRSSVETALAEAVESGQEQSCQHLLHVLNTISVDIANLERLEALVDGFGVSSGRG